MADWQEMVNTCVISLIFAAMLAKLISILVSFRKEKLRIERESIADGSQVSASMDAHTPEEPAIAEQTAKALSENSVSARNDLGGDLTSMDSSRDESSQDKFEEESLLSDEEDWEGIEGTELDTTFGKAAFYLEKLVLDPSVKISNDLKLKFYGLYKQATEGSCSIPQPPAFRPAARAKWNAWKALGNLSQEESMLRYVHLLSELFPNWNQNTKDKTMAESSHRQSSSGKNETRGMGPVFSTLVKESVDHEGLEDIHIFAKEGDIGGLESVLQANIPVDLKDSEGRTALHWAADQGHLEVVKLLISRGAQINLKDSDGQTALHYAATCEWDNVAKFLLEKGADASLVDNDGCTPYVSAA